MGSPPYEHEDEHGESPLSMVALLGNTHVFHVFISVLIYRHFLTKSLLSQHTGAQKRKSGVTESDLLLLLEEDLSGGWQREKGGAIISASSEGLLEEVAFEQG